MLDVPPGRSGKHVEAVLVERVGVSEVDDQIQIVLVLRHIGERAAQELAVPVAVNGDRDLAERSGDTEIARLIMQTRSWHCGGLDKHPYLPYDRDPIYG
jgi:hypothetical protein